MLNLTSFEFESEKLRINKQSQIEKEYNSAHKLETRDFVNRKETAIQKKRVITTL